MWTLLKDGKGYNVQKVGYVWSCVNGTEIYATTQDFFLLDQTENRVFVWGRGFSLSPDTKSFVVSVNDTIHVFDTLTWKSFTIPNVPSWLNETVWSPDGQKIVAVNYSGYIQIFDVGKRSLETVCDSREAYNQEAYCAAWSCKGLLAFGTWQGDVIISDQSLQQTHVIPYRSGNTTRCIVWSPDGNQLIVGSDDGCVRIYDEKFDVVKTCTDAHRGGVLQIVWSPDKQHFATAGYDASVCVWEKTGDFVKRFPTVAKQNAVAWTSNDRLICASGAGVPTQVCVLDMKETSGFLSFFFNALATLFNAFTSFFRH